MSAGSMSRYQALLEALRAAAQTGDREAAWMLAQLRKWRQ